MAQAPDETGRPDSWGTAGAEARGKGRPASLGADSGDCGRPESERGPRRYRPAYSTSARLNSFFPRSVSCSKLSRWISTRLPMRNQDKE